MDMKFAAVCLIATMGWASNCISERSAEFHEARVRSLETDLRGQETIKQVVERRAQHCEEQLRRAEDAIARCSEERGNCTASERALMRALNTRDGGSPDQPPHFHATIPVEPATP